MSEIKKYIVSRRIFGYASCVIEAENPSKAMQLARKNSVNNWNIKTALCNDLTAKRLNLSESDEAKMLRESIEQEIMARAKK